MNNQRKVAVGLIVLGIICIALSFILNNKEYTVSIDANGGIELGNKIVKEGTTIGELETPTREGYIFSHWTADGKRCNNSDKIIKDTQLVAVWEGPIKYKVTFNVDGGSDITDVEVEWGKVLAKPSNPTKEGYVFVEWQLNGVAYDFTCVITKDIELKAMWKKEIKVIVTFDSNGGSKVSSQVVKENESVKKPGNPTKNGYTFVEWQLDGKKYDFTSKVTKDIKLVAKWKKETPREVPKDIQNKLLKLVGINVKNDFLSNEGLEELFVYGKSNVINKESMERKYLFIFYSAPRENWGEEYYDDLPECRHGAGTCIAIKISDFKAYAQKYGITDDTDNIVKGKKYFSKKYNNYYIFGPTGYFINQRINYDSLVFKYEGDSIVLVSKISIFDIETNKLKSKKQITYRFNKRNNDYYLYSFTNKTI